MQKTLKTQSCLRFFLKNLKKPKEKYIFFQNKNENQKRISFLKNVCFYCVLPYKTALGGSWWGAWPYIYITALIANESRKAKSGCLQSFQVA